MAHTHSTGISNLIILISDTHLTAGETMTVTYVFNEAPTYNYTTRVSSFNLSSMATQDTPNGVLSNLVQNSENDRIFTATFTPNANVDKARGRITMDLNDLWVTKATKPCGVFQSVEYTVDTMPANAVRNPKLSDVTISISKDALIGGRSMTVTFEFNGWPLESSFSLDDVSASHGELSDLVRDPNNAKIYTATYTPDHHKNRVVGQITLDLAKLTDADGNAGTGVRQSKEYTVYTLMPANFTNVFIRLGDNHLTAGETTTVTFEFDGWALEKSFALTDVSAPNGVLSNLVRDSNNAKVYTATFTPNANTNRAVGRITLDLKNIADGQEDTGTEGHPGMGVRQSIEYTVDTMPRNAQSNPALDHVSIRLSDTFLGKDESMTVTFEFNGWALESSFTISDIVAPLGVLHDLVRAPNNAKIYTVKFTPHNKTSKAVGRITLDLSKLQDSDGTAGTGVYQSAEYTVDNLPSTTDFSRVNIRISDSQLTAGETMTVTFEFNGWPLEESFALADVVATHGRLSNLVRSTEDARIFTATFTPDANARGVHGRISLDLANVTDGLGSPGTGVYQSSEYSVESAASNNAGTRLNRVNIRLSDNYLSRGEAVTVVFEFNAEPAQVDFLRHVVSPLGTLTNLKWDYNHNEKFCSATFTPNVNMAKGVGRISLDLSKVTDDDGNAGSGVYQSAEYTVDTARPELRITLADTQLSAGETTTVTFAFSKEVSTTSFKAAIDLANARGTLSDPVSADGGKTWTATFTPLADVQTASGVIRVNISGVRDPHGNVGLGDPVSSNAYTVSTVRPTLAATGHSIDDNRLGIGQTAYVTIKFSEPVKGFDASDVVLAPGSGSVGQVFTAWQPAADGSSDTWEVVLHAPGAGATSTNNPISVNLAGVSTRGGSTGLGTVATGLSYSADTIRPTLLSTRVGYDAGKTDTVLKYRETVLVSFTFSEPVTDFGLNDVLLVNGLRDGMLSHFTSTGDGSVWTANLSAPTRNITSSNNTFRVNMRGVTDLAGNAGEGVVATGVSYGINTVGTTAVRSLLIEDRLLAANEETTVTITFTSALDANSFTLDDLEIIDPVTQRKQATDGLRGTLSNLRTTDGGTTWKLTLKSPAADNTSGNLIALKLSGITDPAGNAVSGGNVPGDTTGGTCIAYNQAYTNDSTAPQMAGMVISSRSLGTGGTITFTVTFDEPVTGLTTSAIQLSAGASSGTVSGLNSSDGGRTWIVTISAPTISTTASNVKMSIAKEGIRDLAGNGAGSGEYQAASANLYDVDTSGPAAPPVQPGPLTATITLDDNNLTAGESTTVTFFFSKRVNGFTASDIVLSHANGTLDALTEHADDRTWVATFTPAANVNASSNTIRVNLAGVTAADATNAAGVGQASSSNYSINTVRPSATITLGSISLTAGQITMVRFAFSEAVTGFSAEDVVLTHANGTLGALLSTDTEGKTWTATFTPAENTANASNTIRVNLAGVRNAAGNTGEGQASSAIYVIDTVPGGTVRPTLAVTGHSIDDNQLGIGQTAYITIKFSEPVTGFDASDVILAPGCGSVGQVSAAWQPGTDGSNDTWEVALHAPGTGAGATSTNNPISVDLAGVRNRAGHTGLVTEATGLSYSVDTTRPRLLGTRISHGAGETDTVLTRYETALVSFTFSEPVTGFGLNDVLLVNGLRDGMLSHFTSTGDGSVWTANLSAPTRNITSTNNTFRVNMAGVNDRAGNAGEGVVATGVSYDINTTYHGPTVRNLVIADRVLGPNKTTTITIVFSDALDANNFTLDDLEIIDPVTQRKQATDGLRGTLSNLRSTDGGITWKLTLKAPAADNTRGNLIALKLRDITDRAGNVATGGNVPGDATGGTYIAYDQTYANDSAAPRLIGDILLSSRSLKTGGTITFTLTFDEPLVDFTTRVMYLSAGASSGTMSSLQSTDGGTTWLLTISAPTFSTTASNVQLAIGKAGLKDVHGNVIGSGGYFTAGDLLYNVDT
ncbi:Ig-like domain-containing protein, partial [Verminephrobacter aporrectodeae]|uniref:Ig-like domain-containing protein n=1 Tax=Verminephrobacter aporrectodeae TaxID=1110389 RepID=UPI0022431141